MQFILHAEADDTENEMKFLLCSHSAYHSEHNHLEHVAKSEQFTSISVPMETYNEYNASYD